MRILPIGSVIKVDGVKMMVAGHFTKEIEDKNQYYYVALPYPIGYVDKERMLSVKVDANMDVLYEGYQTERCEKYTEQLNKISQLSPKETAFYTRVAIEAMKTVKGGNQ